jgi:S1-C subfamily serine protease
MAPSPGGIFVGVVTRDSPAESTGIQAGDFIFQLDGRAVSDAREIVSEIERVGSGGSLRLGVRRGAHVRLFRLEPVARPAAATLEKVSAQAVVTPQPSAELEQHRTGD